MSTSIDERIVSMAFENAKFEAAVAVTMSTLSKLNQTLEQIGKANSLGDIEKAASKVTLEQPMSALDKLKTRLFGAGQGADQGLGDIERAGNKITLEAPLTALDKLQAKTGQVGANAATGFNEIERASGRVELAGLSSSIDSVAAKFSTLQAAAAVALGNIASQAAMRGASFAKSFALGPVSAGLSEYTTNLNSIQTILANTQSSGGNLETVNAALNDLNHYSDQTIYNFGEMAKNIGTFTAAGVKLDTATQSIKGIANLAALSGSNSQQASTAMYQLSQAIAAGKVNLQDWNSVVNAGMGGEVFQKALFDTGKAMGTITNSPVKQTFEEWKKAGNSFRQSLSANQKSATKDTSVLAKAQKDAAESVKEAHSSSAEAIANASERVKDTQKSAAEANVNAAKRVKEAQESQAEATVNAAERVKSAQESQAESAKSASDKVKEAQKAVSDSAKQTTIDVKAAQDAQKETFLQGAADVKAALDTVTEARKKLVEAMKPPSADELQAATDNLKTAQLDQADLATAVTDAQTEQKRSAEDLAAAEKRLRDTRSSGGSPEEVLAASRAVEDAQKRQKDSSDAVERAILKQNAATRGLHDAQTELQETQQKGTDQDQKVVDAKDSLSAAIEKQRIAELKNTKDNLASADKVTKARLDGIAAQKDASADLAAAEKQQTEILIKGRKAVADAEKDQAKTIIDARESVAKAEKDQAETIIDSRESVAKAEKDQAKTIKDSRESVTKAEESAAERIKAARATASGKDVASPAPSWLTSDVLTSTLKQFTGDMTTAQLKAQGFSDAQIKNIQKQAQLAKDSATKVKTLGQVFDIARETLGSGWSATFKNIFGNFEEARTTFTGLSTTINGFINTNANARNKVLKDWKELGGRTVLIEGIKQVFKDLLAILKPIKDAFREIFPPKTGKDLFDLTVNFRDLAKALEPSKETVENLKRTFAGFFAVVHIGWTIVKDLVGVIFDLLGVAGKGGGGFLNFTGSIGDFLVALDKALTQGGLLKGFFAGLTAVLKLPIELFSHLAKIIFGLFGGEDDSKASALSGSLDKVGKAAGPLTPILDSLKKAWDGIVKVFKEAKEKASPWLDHIGEQISNLGATIGNALSNLDFNKAMGALQTAFIGGIFLALKKAISGNSGALTGALSGLNKVFGSLTGTLEGMQQRVKAQAILMIAGAIGILAASIFILSTIDPKRLASALAALAVGMGELMVAIKLMTTGLGKAGILTLPVLAIGLVGVAAATVILAAAMKIFATMKWEDIAKGLAGVGGGLVAIGIGMKALGPGTLIQGPALIAIAIALNLLALAVKQFASMKWEDMAKGLAGVFGVLAAVAVPLAAMGPSIALVGPGLIAAGIGINLLAKAVSSFSEMDPGKMAIGILGIGAALVVLGAAISMIPPTVALQAAGLVVLSIALVGIAGAIALMGKMNVGQIIKGLATLGGALAILAIGLSAMSGTLIGSVALLAAAGALAILAPTLGFMGTLNWGTIIKGLVAIALVLGTLSAVGLVASEGLVSLGISLLPLAGVLVLTAGAMFIFAKALALLGDNGAKGIAVMGTAIVTFVALLPSLVINFLQGLVDIIAAIAAVAPKVIVALGVILDTIIAFVIAQAPKLAIAIGALVDAFVQVLVTNAPKLVAAGYKLLIDFLTGIDQNIAEITTRVVSIITQFLNGLAESAPKLTASGANFLIQFLNGIAAQLPKLVEAAINVVTKFIEAVFGKLPDILLLGTKLMVSFIGAITGQLVNVFNMGLKIITQLLSGLAQAVPKMVEKAGDIAAKFVAAVASGLIRLTTAGADALINFINGLANVIRTKGPELRAAGWNLADAIIDGMVDGFKELGNKAIDSVKGVIGGLPGAAKKVLGINSPSKVFMEIGKFTGQGLVVGLQSSSGDVASAAGNMGDSAVSAIQDSMKRAGDFMTQVGVDPNPTITPVLDLSNIRKGAKELSGLTDIPGSGVSFGMAASISTETQQSAEEQAAAGEAVPAIKFEQTNISPEPLSSAEVYRLTNNELSKLRSQLGFVPSREAL